YHSGIVRAAIAGCAVYISGSVEDYVGDGPPAVRGVVSLEVVEDRLHISAAPVGRQLVDSPLKMSSAARSRAIKVAGRIPNDPSVGVVPGAAKQTEVKQHF